MQVILGKIKTLGILISNSMPDQKTDQDTAQPAYRLRAPVPDQCLETQSDHSFMHVTQI